MGHKAPRDPSKILWENWPKTRSSTCGSIFWFQEKGFSSWRSWFLTRGLFWWVFSRSWFRRDSILAICTVSHQTACCLWTIYLSLNHLQLHLKLREAVQANAEDADPNPSHVMPFILSSMHLPKTQSLMGRGAHGSLIIIIRWLVVVELSRVRQRLIHSWQDMLEWKKESCIFRMVWSYRDGTTFLYINHDGT